MKNYEMNKKVLSGYKKVKPYNTNREKDKVRPAQLLASIVNGSDADAVRIARKIVNANKTNTKIDRNEYLIRTVKGLLVDEVEIGDYGTKYDFEDVVAKMRKDGMFTMTKQDICITTLTFLALDELVNDGIFNKKKMRSGGWRDRAGDMHYRYETVYECVR